MQPVSPLVEPYGIEAHDREIDAYLRCTESAAPDYASMMSVPTKLEQPLTRPPLVAVVVNWIVFLALTFGFEPLLLRYQDK